MQNITAVIFDVRYFICVIIYISSRVLVNYRRSHILKVVKNRRGISLIEILRCCQKFNDNLHACKNPFQAQNVIKRKTIFITKQKQRGVLMSILALNYH